MSDATARGQDAVDAVRGVGDEVIEMVDEFAEKASLYHAAGDGARHRVPAGRHLATMSTNGPAARRPPRDADEPSG